MGVVEAQQHLPPTRSGSALQARHVDGDDVWTLELSGEADIATLTMLTQELREGVRANRPRLVIDLAGLRFCDVGSAELIMAVSRTAPVSLTGVAGSVKRVLDLLGHEGYPSHAGSLASFDRPPRLAGSRREMVRGASRDA